MDKALDEASEKKWLIVDMKKAWSISANILYSPLTPLTFGVELMRAFRVLEHGDSGKFDRLQISAKYDFDFVTTITDK